MTIWSKAVEVGNIFTLATKFSDALGLTYKDETGEVKPVFMGSYGIGPTCSLERLLKRSRMTKVLSGQNQSLIDVHLVVIGSEKPDVAAHARNRR